MGQEVEAGRDVTDDGAPGAVRTTGVALSAAHSGPGGGAAASAGDLLGQPRATPRVGRPVALRLFAFGDLAQPGLLQRLSLIHI